MSGNALLKQTLQAVMNGFQRHPADTYRPHWHLSPVVGLMNDPNGFIQYEGRYHLFYQWNPLACDHSLKCWGHWSSADLVNWQHEPIALLPDEEFDRHGCFSGSAVNDDGELVLVYTGNIEFDDGDRTAWQCLARLNQQGEFIKQAVVGQPEGYTGHIRDPKVWRHDGQWYMVLAAQDLELQGKVLLLRSEDLTEWTLLGEIAGSGLGGIARFGYMWECPDLFILENKEVLITCPQGVDAEARRYLNQYQSGYFVGDLDYDTGRYQHGPFTELDYGHEFYAPQTTQTEDGRRLLIGWMGVPDQDEFSQPTIRHGWLHIMTCPRELTLQGELLYQRPARELQSLRDQYQRYTDVANAVPECAVTQAELVIKTDGVFQANFADTLWLHCEDEGVTLLRKGLLDGADEYRYWPGKVETLQILCDSSSIEIFINDGQGVMSSRYFPAKPATVTFSGEAQLEVEHWLLRKAATGIGDN